MGTREERQPPDTGDRVQDVPAAPDAIEKDLDLPDPRPDPPEPSEGGSEDQGGGKDE